MDPAPGELGGSFGCFGSRDSTVDLVECLRL